jgi:uracil-DNA glycosylase family protein
MPPEHSLAGSVTRPRWPADDESLLSVYWGMARSTAHSREATETPKTAHSRSQADARSAADFVPPRLTLPALREAAAGCRGCTLYQRATQTVFGEGATKAEMMLVGEQPGDQEDLSGHPFVGPAGRLLDKALSEAGIERDRAYVTNAVKHFKWKPVGKRRMHDKPRVAEINACRPWLEAEIEVVQPRVLVCLGATAAQALLGPQVRVTRQRGQVIESRWAPATIATIHPSAILRAPDEAARHRRYDSFVADLRVAARRLSESVGKASG